MKTFFYTILFVVISIQATAQEQIQTLNLEELLKIVRTYHPLIINPLLELKKQMRKYSYQKVILIQF
jgi:hypothetical protein